MSKIKIDKVVSVLPSTLIPDTVYAVRSGGGFDLYFSDVTGSVAHKLNSDNVLYDNTISGLNSDNVKEAIDELKAELPDTTNSPVATVADAQGSTLGLEQGLLAAAGQPALTVLAVGQTNTGKVQGCSLGNGNVIQVYESGADFSAGNVFYREFMSLGEPICFTGLSNGAIITSTQGFYGFSENINGNTESPMPLLSYGLSFKETFLYAFRTSTVFSLTDSPVNNAGRVIVVNGALSNTIKLTDGAGVTTQGQEDIVLQPWERTQLGTDGNKEYILSGTNNMMACFYSDDGFYDMRLIMPLTNDGITWPRSGFVSAPYNNTQVEFFTRDNVTGFLNSTAGTGVSPNSPVDFDAGVGVGTGANDQDYEPNGATRVFATGLISAYSGADSAGLEASPLMPVSGMSQVVAQPLFIDDIGDGGNSGIAIASPYEGTARVYSWDTVTSSLILEYTVLLTRNGVTINSQKDQMHPASGLISNDAQATNTLEGDLNAGVIIADVPITVVVQNGTQSYVPTLRSQNGTTTTSIVNDDDETLSLGWTPADLKAEVKLSFEDDIKYKRVIPLGGGNDNWVVA